MADAAFAFDTLATARKLRAAGVQPGQAEAHAEALGAAVSASRGDLATNAVLKSEIAGLETRMTVRLYGVAAGIVAANAGLTFILMQLFGQAN